MAGILRCRDLPTISRRVRLVGEACGLLAKSHSYQQSIAEMCAEYESAYHQECCDNDDEVNLAFSRMIRVLRQALGELNQLLKTRSGELEFLCGKVVAFGDGRYSVGLTRRSSEFGLDAVRLN